MKTCHPLLCQWAGGYRLGLLPSAFLGTEPMTIPLLLSLGTFDLLSSGLADIFLLDLRKEGSPSPYFLWVGERKVQHSMSYSWKDHSCFSEVFSTLEVDQSSQKTPRWHPSMWALASLMGIWYCLAPSVSVSTETFSGKAQR